MYPYLERWIDRAFHEYLCVVDKDQKVAIARLMRWVLPSHKKTLAVSWSIAADRGYELLLQQRVFSIKESAEDMVSAYQALFREEDHLGENDCF